MIQKVKQVKIVGKVKLPDIFVCPHCYNIIEFVAGGKDETRRNRKGKMEKQ